VDFGIFPRIFRPPRGSAWCWDLLRAAGTTPAMVNTWIVVLLHCKTGDPQKLAFLFFPIHGASQNIMSYQYIIQ